MTRTLSNLATVTSTLMAMIIILGLALTMNSAQAGSKPSEAYFVRVDRDTTTSARPAAPGRSIKRADGNVCCSMPRTGRLALVKPSDCRAVKGRIVNKTKCARVKRVSARKFSNIVLKRGLTSRNGAASSAPRSLSPGAAKGVTCSNGNYYPCWCSGEEICNLFISACVEDGGEVGCTGHNEQTGEPNECACVK